MRAYESDQFAIAVTVGTTADVHTSDAVRIRDVSRDSRELSDFCHHIPCGRVSGQPLSVPTQEPSKCWDVPGRGLELAFEGDEASPGCQDRTNRGPYLSSGGVHRVSSDAFPGNLPYHAYYFRTCASVAVGVQRGETEQVLYQEVPARHTQEPPITSPARPFSRTSVPCAST